MNTQIIPRFCILLQFPNLNIAHLRHNLSQRLEILQNFAQIKDLLFTWICNLLIVWWSSWQLYSLKMTFQIDVYAFHNPIKKARVQSKIAQLQLNLIFWQLLQLSNAHIVKLKEKSRSIGSVFWHLYYSIPMVLISGLDFLLSEKSGPKVPNCVVNLHIQYVGGKR